MSLPIAWVDKIFLKLTLNFGREFLGRWEGVPIEDVKADWAHELRGYQQNPSAIAYGLEHCLGGKPPTVQEFKAICNKRPDSNLALPSPPADPERAAAELKKLEQAKKINQVNMKAWAYRLQARDKAGEPINLNQRRCYRAALGIEV
jgi:hypothetical protein